MSSVDVALVNALMYTLTLFAWWKSKGFTMGVLLWLFFCISAWSTYFFIQVPLYRFSIHYSDLKLVPFIYLYVGLYLLISPVTKLKPLGKDSIVFTHRELIKYFMLFSIVVQAAAILVNAPYVMKALSVTQATVTAYKDYSYQIETYVPSLSLPIIAQLNGWILAAFKTFSFGFSFILYFCYKKERMIVTWFFITTLAETFTYNILIASRGQLMFYTLYAIVMLYFVHNYISKKDKHRLYIFGGAFGLVLISFVTTITLGRFSHINYVLWKYMGESMNNFNGLLFYNMHGITEGKAYLLSFVNDLMGNTIYSSTMEKWIYIYKKTGVSGQFFYTIIGGFILEFGKVATMIIVLILNRIFTMVFRYHKIYNIAQIAVLLYIFYYLIKGVFMFPIQGKVGFLQIVALLLIWCYFNQKFRWRHIMLKNAPRRDLETNNTKK